MSCRCCPGSETRAAVSTALESEVSGFFISCDTSAAKRSTASIRFHRSAVMSRSATDKSPISSRRAVKSGIFRCSSRPPLTCRAASASRFTGRVIVLAR